MPTFWTEIYQQHFQHHFNKPFDVQVYHGPAGEGLKVATHDQARPGFHVLASVGLADKLAESEGEDFGEVILFCDVQDKEVPKLFVNALFFILQFNIPLGSRFAIGFADMAADFVKRYGKSSLYFTHPADKDEKFDKVRKGETFGRVYQAFFIDAAEAAYLEENGPHIFEQRFRKQFDAEENLKAWSVRRDSCLAAPNT